MCRDCKLLMVSLRSLFRSICTAGMAREMWRTTTRRPGPTQSSDPGFLLSLEINPKSKSRSVLNLIVENKRGRRFPLFFYSRVCQEVTFHIPLDHCPQKVLFKVSSTPATTNNTTAHAQKHIKLSYVQGSPQITHSVIFSVCLTSKQPRE